MLKDITFQNFKCFKKKSRVLCGGVTLLYGKNSAGKTSAVKGTLFLKRVLEGVSKYSCNDEIIKAPNIPIPSSRHSSLSFGGYDEIPTNKIKPFQLGASCYNSFEGAKYFNTNGFCFFLSDFKTEENTLSSFNSALIQKLQILDRHQKPLFQIRNSKERLNHLFLTGRDDSSRSTLNEIYYTFTKSIEWEEFDQKFLKYCIDCVAINARKKFYKENGISYFKKKILEINENNEYWFYGDQPEFDSSDLESREYFEGEYDYFYDGAGGPEPFYRFDEKVIKILRKSKSLSDFLIGIIRANKRRFLNDRYLEYAYYVKCGDSEYKNLGWIESNKRGRVYGDPLGNLLLGEIQNLQEKEFTFIPLNFSRKRIYDLDDIYSRSNTESPEYTIAEFIDFISEGANVRDLNKQLKTLGVDYEILSPNLEKMNGFVEIKILDLSFGKELNIYDIGFGTTHFIFTIAAIMGSCRKKNPGNVLFLEEPEVHCHPDLQGKLALLIMSAVHKGTQIVIDTHSEIFALAFSQAIRERKSNFSEFIDYNDQKVPTVVFNYFSKGRRKLGTSISSLLLDSNGEFVDEDGNPADWPDEKGFFGQRYDYS